MATSRSYTDSHWDGIEASLEAEFGLPKGGMKAIRTKGERSNSGDVSPVGARTVYQIMPNTRTLFSKRYGVDAYADDDGRSAARVAALHLRDDMKKYGWDGAVMRYIGGPDKRKWGKTTRDYYRRVTGKGMEGSDAGRGYSEADPSPDVPTIDYSGDWLNSSPGYIGPDKNSHVAKETHEEKRKRLNKATLGTEDLYTSHVRDERDAGAASIREAQREATVQSNEDRQISPWSRLAASWHDNTLTAAIIRHAEDKGFTPEEGFVDYYMKNRVEIEQGHDAGEVAELRGAMSLESLNSIRADIKHRREQRELYTARGVTQTDAVLYSLVGSIPDPYGFIAGEGAGQVFRAAGMGARAAYAAGRPIVGTAKLAGEFAVGNVAVTAGLDLEGDHMTSQDYANAAGFGGGLAAVAAPFHLRTGRADRAVGDWFADIGRRSRAERDELYRAAEAAAGPNASPEAVARAAQRIDAERMNDTVSIALADQPDEVKFLNGENVITANEQLRVSTENQHGLDSISDDAERKMATEMTARSARIMAANPVDETRLDPATRLGGMESTGVTLLRSKSVVARAIGTVLLEGTTGAAGRRRTAALAQHARERVYNSELTGYMDLYHLYRKQNGYGLISEAWNGTGFKKFEREVFLEIERRADETGYVPHENQLIRDAADMVERGFEKMRVEQQHIQTVGHARLGDTSKGYVPHRIKGAALALMSENKAAIRALRRELSRQFQGPENGFDADFSDKLATKYVEQAIRRAKGGADVPMNLHTSEAADIVQDALTAMKLDPSEVEKIMGKFSRGGASHTKKRLRLNLDADIGDGKKLADLFDTSVSNLYRGYSRRVSGEVALAQFGIMGKKGLMVARAAMDATGATTAELRAFDQVAAEFLNTPFGEHNHKWMDNARIATSLARLGGMGFTQFGEYGNALAALGAQRMFATIGDFGRLRSEIAAIHKGNPVENPILKDLDTLGGHLGLDEYVNTRLFDVPDNDIQVYGPEQVGVVTRFLRAGANAQAILSGHRMILGAQVRGMSEQIVRKAMHYVKKGGDDIALDDMGITAELRGRLRENMDRIATFRGDKLEKLDLHAGDLTGHEIMTLRDAIERGAGQIIQRTYIGETGKWAHDGFLKLLTQFRTFGLTSIEKQWGRNKANYGAIKSLAYLVGSMSFAAPIYMARMQLKMIGMEEEKAKEYADQHLNPAAIGLATLNYASASGLASDILDVGFGAYSGMLGQEAPESVGARGQARGGFVGGTIAPGVGLVNDLYTGTVGGRYDRLPLPGKSLPYMQPAINALDHDE